LWPKAGAAYCTEDELEDEVAADGAVMPLSSGLAVGELAAPVVALLPFMAESELDDTPELTAPGCWSVEVEGMVADGAVDAADPAALV